MFSGIVEAVSPILRIEDSNQAVRFWIRRPDFFNDLKPGDSIAVNGVCLTLETSDDESMQFALAAESLKVLQWESSKMSARNVNLERSLRFGDRIHGHLVSGHVEALGTVVRNELVGESCFLDVEIPSELSPFLWKKGGMTVHGVSLTVNDVVDSKASFCLIPETIKRTNLGDLRPGDKVHLEADYLAKMLLHSMSNKENLLAPQLLPNKEIL